VDERKALSGAGAGLEKTLGAAGDKVLDAALAARGATAR
jgi:hypothetical protein